MGEWKNLGMLFLSSKNDDILMWSHYTGGHRGLCLEFDKNVMANEFHVDKVNYRKKYPSFREFRKLPGDGKTSLLLLTKSYHWKYESEWRSIINVVNDIRTMSFPPEMLTGVICGSEVNEKDRKMVQSWARKHSTPVETYQAIKKKNKYSLDILGLI